MKRIKYINIDALKQKYLSFFRNEQVLLDQWPTIRNSIVSIGGNKHLYPLKIADLLIADFESLARLFYDYIKLDLPSKSLKVINELFAYSPNRQKNISLFFVESAVDIDISTCYYCDTAYINAYSVKSKVKKHFDLDHFLPKSICPLVSLSLFNLIPCCPVCNQRLKRNRILGKNAQEAILLSPSSRYYAFDDNSHFAVLPKHIGKCALSFMDNMDNYKVEIHSKLSVCREEIQLFCLNDRYNFHKCEALRLLDLMRDYPPAYIKMIHNALCQNGIFYPEGKISEDIFGNLYKQKYNRTLAKFVKDIMKIYK